MFLLSGQWTGVCRKTDSLLHYHTVSVVTVGLVDLKGQGSSSSYNSCLKIGDSRLGTDEDKVQETLETRTRVPRNTGPSTTYTFSF